MLLAAFFKSVTQPVRVMQVAHHSPLTSEGAIVFLPLFVCLLPLESCPSSPWFLSARGVVCHRLLHVVHRPNQSCHLINEFRLRRPQHTVVHLCASSDQSLQNCCRQWFPKSIRSTRLRAWHVLFRTVQLQQLWFSRTRILGSLVTHVS